MHAIIETNSLSHSTIEVMYLSFRRSQHALLALSFFVVMMLTVFSTLLWALFNDCLAYDLTILDRYFAERGTWDNVLETFVNADGDPSQFAVRQSRSSIRTSR